MRTVARFALTALAFGASSAHAMLPGAVVEPGITSDKAYSLNLQMCTSDQKVCHPFPVTESTLLYQMLSKETCVAAGRALAIIKAQEGYENGQPPIPLYKVVCGNVSADYKMDIITNTYTSKDFGL